MSASHRQTKHFGPACLMPDAAALALLDKLFPILGVLRLHNTEKRSRRLFSARDGSLELSTSVQNCLTSARHNRVQPATRYACRAGRHDCDHAHIMRMHHAKYETPETSWKMKESLLVASQKARCPTRAVLGPTCSQCSPRSTCNR